MGCNKCCKPVSRNDIPKGAKVVTILEHLVRKYDGEDKFEKVKMRNCVRGDLLEIGRHFFETWSPNVHADTTRIFFGMAAYNLKYGDGTPPDGGDVVSAYLQADVSTEGEEYYIEVPRYFELATMSLDDVYRLRSELLALKKSNPERYRAVTNPFTRKKGATNGHQLGDSWLTRCRSW